MVLEPETVGGFELGIVKREEVNESVSEFAFNSRVAYEIKENNNWMCEITGRKKSDGWRLDASHINHDKNNPYYNNTRNGECLCLTEHLKFHIGIYQDYLNNGTEDQIAWAVCSLRLISKRAYSRGLRTDEHYQDKPLDIIDDRDEVVEVLKDAELNPTAFIYC